MKDLCLFLELCFYVFVDVALTVRTKRECEEEGDLALFTRPKCAKIGILEASIALRLQKSVMGRRRMITQHPPRRRRRCRPPNNVLVYPPPMPRRSSRRRYARMCVFSFLTHPWSPKSRFPPPSFGVARKERKYSNRLLSSSWSQMEFSMG